MPSSASTSNLSLTAAQTDRAVDTRRMRPMSARNRPKKELRTILENAPFTRPLSSKKTKGSANNHQSSGDQSQISKAPDADAKRSTSISGDQDMHTRSGLDGRTAVVDGVHGSTTGSASSGDARHSPPMRNMHHDPAEQQERRQCQRHHQCHPPCSSETRAHTLRAAPAPTVAGEGACALGARPRWEGRSCRGPKGCRGGQWPQRPSYRAKPPAAMRPWSPPSG